MAEVLLRFPLHHPVVPDQIELQARRRCGVVLVPGFPFVLDRFASDASPHVRHIGVLVVDPFLFPCPALGASECLFEPERQHFLTVAGQPVRFVRFGDAP